MADKKEGTAAEEQADEQTSDEPQEQEGETEEADSGETSEQPDIDWKQIAEDERQKREKAEKALSSKRFNASRGRTEEDDLEDEPEERTLTEAQLRSILQENSEAQEKKFMGVETRRIARDLSSSDDEANAIVEIYNNRTFPSFMTHEEKVREAYFIAHGPRILAKQDELRRSLRSKQTTRSGGDENAHRDGARPSEPKLAPTAKAELSRLGFKWDGRRYSKKLANGKTLVRGQNGKTIIED